MISQNNNDNNKGIEKISFWSLVGLAIGSTVGGGVFSMSGDMAAHGAHTGAVLIGWLFCGLGMLGLVISFYGLNQAKPELTGGISSYAATGFGQFVGFNSAWGYWISAIFANVSFITFLFSSIGYFFPIFEGGNNFPALVGASILLWTTTLLILRGVGQASFMNLVITFAKLIPIVLFAIAVLLYQSFHWDIFMQNFWGTSDGLSLLDQIRATSSTTIWSFIGIEGAVAVSERARNPKHVGIATITSFASVLLLYIIISVLSCGVLPFEELAALGNPPLAGIMESIVGPWGSIFINLAVIVSVAGAFFGYTIVAADCALAAAHQNLFPQVFSSKTRTTSPKGALLITNIGVQLFLIILHFNESTYQIFYFLSASMIMFPYLLSALYFVKIQCQKNELFANNFKPTLFTIGMGILGSIYGVWLMYASGWQGVLSSMLMYLPGIAIYVKARQEQHQSIWSSSFEPIIAMSIVLFASIAMYWIWIGAINPFA